MSSFTTLSLGNGGAVFVETITGNTGGPVPASPTGNINVIGAGNITVSGNPATYTETITLVGTTNHSIQLGNASGSLTSLGVATNGQLPIGSAGADPVLATLTAGTGISITNGAGSITIDATGGSVLAYTNVNTTPYVVLSGDQYISVDCSGGAITIELPNTATTGRVIVIKDRTGSAATNNITVTTVGGLVLIDGSASFVMNTNFESIEVIFNSANYEVF